MIITVKNGNFPSGLGSTDWIKTFAQKAEIENSAIIQAYRKLYDDCVAAGLWSNIYGIATFPGSSAATQKYIFKDVPFGEEFPVLEFTGNGSSADGWTPGLGIYALAPFNMPAGNISNFSFGLYNSTSEVAPGTGFGRRAMEMVDNTSPSNYSWALTRYFQDTVVAPVAGIGLASTSNDKAFPASGSYDMTKKGFLQGVKQGNTIRLYDNGTVIASNTNATQVMVGGGNRKLVLGTGMGTDGTIVVVNGAKGPSLARYPMFYWGALTFAQAVTFNTIVNTFLTSIGRAAA